MKNLTKAAFLLPVLLSSMLVSVSRAEEDCSKIQTDIQEKNLASDSNVPSEEKKESDSKTAKEIE